MGYRAEAKCKDCGNNFLIDHGGGFSFHLVRCTKCGKTKTVVFQDIGELHLRYLKGLPEPYCIASSEYDESVRKNAPIEPISEEDYHKGIEAFVGNYRCGGKYNLNASPRCPKCRSTQIEEGRQILNYD